MTEAKFHAAILSALDRGPGSEADASAFVFLLTSSEAVTVSRGDDGQPSYLRAPDVLNEAIAKGEAVTGETTYSTKGLYKDLALAREKLTDTAGTFASVLEVVVSLREYACAITRHAAGSAVVTGGAYTAGLV
jgi:hypothetical protein